jgi:hypothetical protein
VPALNQSDAHRNATFRFLSLFLLYLPTPALAQDAKLIEAAKKEDRLVLSGTMQPDIFDLLQRAFLKKTGITVDC